MASTYTQVPPDSTGDKLHMQERVRGADTVLQQAVFIGEAPTWTACADAVAFAASKHHVTLFNASASGVVVHLHEIRPVNLSLTTVTGVGIRFDIRACSAASAGTTITPVAFDTNNPSLPAGVTVRTGGTVTTGALLAPFTSNNDEIPLTGLGGYNFPSPNIVPNVQRMQPFTLREGQGITVQQVTSSTVGSWAWVLCFSVESTYT